jgi:hypothetical protein
MTMGVLDHGNSVPFVLAQLDVGIAYAGFACEPYLDATYRLRYRQHAERVHHNAMKLLTDATLTDTERAAILAKLDLLITAIAAIPDCPV